MITQEQLENFFAETRETYRSGRSNWNIDDVCRWSYFFVDQIERHSPQSLYQLNQGLHDVAARFGGGSS